MSIPLTADMSTYIAMQREVVILAKFSDWIQLQKTSHRNILKGTAFMIIT